MGALDRQHRYRHHHPLGPLLHHRAGTSAGIAFATADSNNSPKFVIQDNGNVGIGTTSPDMLLTVGSNSPSGSVAHFENSTGSCYINPTTTSLSCSSDSRLKTNVVPLESADGLAAVLKLNPVTYNWKTESATTSPHTGFIAQDVQPVLPDLVSQGPDGYYTLNYAGLTPYLVKAIQEIANITGAFKTNLIAWLADAQNGIAKIVTHIMVADEVDTTTTSTQKLCTTRSNGTQVCVTNDQLASLLSQVGAANTPSSAVTPDSGQTSNSTIPDNANATTTTPVSTPDASSAPPSSNESATTSPAAIDGSRSSSATGTSTQP